MGLEYTLISEAAQMSQYSGLKHAHSFHVRIYSKHEKRSGAAPHSSSVQPSMLPGFKAKRGYYVGSAGVSG